MSLCVRVSVFCPFYMFLFSICRKIIILLVQAKRRLPSCKFVAHVNDRVTTTREKDTFVNGRIDDHDDILTLFDLMSFAFIIVKMARER